MFQSLLSLLSAVILTIANIFPMQIPSVPEKGDPIIESAPTLGEYQTADRIEGVNSSVFYIKRPMGEFLKEVNASDFGMNTQSGDNYTSFCKAIEYCKEHPNTRLKIDGGTYFFKSDKTIGISGLQNVLIDCDNAVFVFEHDKYFHISNCDSLEIKGLSVDWNRSKSRLGSLVKIKNASKKNRTLELEFTELQNVSEDIPIMALTQYDADTLTPGAKAECKEVYVYSRPEMIEKVEKTDSNVLKITHDGSFDKFENGDVFMLRHYVYGGNVFYLGGESENVTFNDVSIYSAAGMCYLMGGKASHFQIINSYVGLAPGKENEQRISATADAVHIAGTKGFFRIDGCDFSFMGDDALNVHDNVLYVSQQLDDSTVRAYGSSDVLFAGDSVKFKTSGYKDLDGTAKIKSAYHDGEQNFIEFSSALPEDIGEGTILYNADTDSGNYVVTNNYFHENRARALLLQSDNGLCKNNRFYKIMGPAIRAVVDIIPGSWCEGTGVNNLEISGNVFEMCSYSDWGEVITLSTNINSKKADVPIFSNIKISGNTFINMSSRLIKAENTAGMEVVGNTVINDMFYPSMNFDRGRIVLGNHCGNIKIDGNKWKKSPYMFFPDFVKMKDVKAIVQAGK